MKNSLLLQSVYFNLINLVRLSNSQILLLFLLIGLNSYSQTTPSNIRIKGYERHNELKWDKLNGTDEIVVDIYRSTADGPSVKVGTTTDAIFIDYFGDGISDSGWNYRVQSHNPQTGSSSAISGQFYIGPPSEMTDDEFLDMVQEYTFRYFWDYAHPTSGMIYECNGSCPDHPNPDLTTSGGTGFGIMAIPVGIERGYITRQQGIDRVLKIVNFLDQDTERYHGVWAHWINGRNGNTIPFDDVGDDAADLIETAFLVQGLLTVQGYFDQADPQEAEIRTKIQKLWEEVDWNWFRKKPPLDYLMWHWSPIHEWKKNLAIRGWHEGLIAYILAIASPTHAVPPSLYHTGWARNGDFKSGKTYDGTILPLGKDRGGPLFLSQYSFLGLDPTKVGDKYIRDYFEQGRAQTLINRAYCMNNPGNYKGYDENCWGLTASQTPPPLNYKAHEPSTEGDNGTITPTAAISAMPYTPKESIEALKHFYREHGASLWGPMGFYDAFNQSKNWTSPSYLAIDQGPIVLMIENYRSKLLWKNFMKNDDIIHGIESIETTRPIVYDYDDVVERGTIKVFINGKEKLSVNPSENSEDIVQNSNIEAMVGDELIIEVYDTNTPPSIKGLPDLWVARAFINEGIFMSSKSITPGAYRPWVPFSTVSHSTLAVPFNRQWLGENGEYESNRYPEWVLLGDKYRLRWTLQRTMDPNLQYTGKKIDYRDKYPDEDVPWWQTWDEHGNPIADGTGKFNKDGHVPYGEHPKPNGTYPQRQGKNVGMDMITLHAMKGTLNTAFGNNTNFRDGSPYFVKSDNDDTYTTEFKSLSTEPYNVTTPRAELQRPFTELWKVVPDGEMNNPVSEIVTWYQKAIHRDAKQPLPSDYIYDGYEIWEDDLKNPSSKAPGEITITSGNQNLRLTLEVQSPLEDDAFYTLFKENDNEAQRDFVVSTNELVIGMDKNVKGNLVNQMKSNKSKFDLVLGYSTWDPQYEVHPLTLNDDGFLSGNRTFDLKTIKPGPALHAFLSYKRTPVSEPVIISGTDFWLSFNIEALRCEEYRNESESRSLKKKDFAINALNNENYIDELKHLTQGYALSNINEEFTIMEGEKLTFKVWDNVDFAFEQTDTKWYMSSRKRRQQLMESDAAKRVKITLTKIANNGKILETKVLQDWNTGSSLTHAHTFSEVGNYIYEASLERKDSGYKVFVRVLDPEFYGTGDEGRVKVRDFLPQEIEYINKVLTDDEKIKGSDYKLAMVTDVQASFAWKQPSSGGGPRSFIDSNGNVEFIDRFAPFNDYADHYVYHLNDDSHNKLSTQNIDAIQKYITTRDPQFKLLPGIWVNHLDPLGESDTKYGIQDKFNLGSRIQDVNSQFIQSAFTQVQSTYADKYMVNYFGKMINSRSPRDWEIRLPWGSLSKYHGFRLRTAPKSPVNAEKLANTILDIGKKVGGYFQVHGVGGSGVGTGNYGGTDNDLINPLLNPKSGILDTDKQRLEYAFFLNLKHNRWVIIPNSVEDITFYHGDDQQNRIASGFQTDAPELSGLIPIEITPADYFLVNTKDKCFSSKGPSTFKWIASKGSDGSWNPGCTACQVVKEDNPQDGKRASEGEVIYERILKLKSKKKYIRVDATNSLEISDSKSKIIPYQVDSEPTENNISAFFGNDHSTGLTTSAYKMVHLATPPDQGLPHQPVAHSLSAGQITGISVGVGGVAAAAIFYFRRPIIGKLRTLGYCRGNSPRIHN